MMVWSTSTASVRLRVDRGLAVAEFVGRLQAEDAPALYARCALAPEQGAQVALVDVRGLRTEAAMLDLLPPKVSGATGLAVLPGVLLVRPSEYALYRAYAWALAERRGVIRGVFTEAAPAVAWLLARAETLAPRLRNQSSAPAWQAAACDVLAPRSQSAGPHRLPAAT